MAYPKPLPSLSYEEWVELNKQLENFEVSEEQKERIEKDRKAIREE